MEADVTTAKAKATATAKVAVAGWKGWAAVVIVVMVMVGVVMVARTEAGAARESQRMVDERISSHLQESSTLCRSHHLQTRRPSTTYMLK